MKKTARILPALALTAALLAGCGNSGAASTPAGSAPAVSNAPISVVSREDGSGTRGAFVELFGVEQKNAEGKKVDYTTDTAEITNSTAVMLTTVAGNSDAIGYVSLGSLDDSVKALTIDGTAATVDNIKSGAYTVARPFNIATTDSLSAVAQDFVNYILSDEGQAIVESSGYISQGATGAYAGAKASGTITVAGSSSVSPVMEKLAEAYMAINSGVSIELQTSDSTTGMTSAAQGLCDIGMASRDLKDSETEAGLTATVIAMDGIAVIVNQDNAVDGLTLDQVRDIYTGDVTEWSALQG